MKILGIILFIAAIEKCIMAIMLPEVWWIPTSVGVVFLGLSIGCFWDKLSIIYESLRDNIMKTTYYICMACFMVAIILVGIFAIFEILYLIWVGLVFLVFAFLFLYQYNKLKKANWDLARLSFSRSVRKWRYLFSFNTISVIITIVFAVKLNFIWFIIITVINCYLILDCLLQIKKKTNEYISSRRNVETNEFESTPGIQPSDFWLRFSNSQEQVPSRRDFQEQSHQDLSWRDFEDEDRKEIFEISQKMIFQKSKKKNTIKDRLDAIE